MLLPIAHLWNAPPRQLAQASLQTAIVYNSPTTASLGAMQVIDALWTHATGVRMPQLTSSSTRANVGLSGSRSRCWPGGRLPGRSGLPQRFTRQYGRLGVSPREHLVPFMRSSLIHAVYEKIPDALLGDGDKLRVDLGYDVAIVRW